MNKKGFVYFMSNAGNSVIYTGITSNLTKRVWEHKTGKYPDSFSARYKLNKLVYWEEYDDIRDAIAREKQLKAGSRKNKVALIVKENKGWEDLSRGVV
ncbi:MAG: Excinuclease ABC C subunit domain protein [Parcubacteria group bacterium GW2011_GWC2_39_14]|nr:MAG: Excinuclease ABC C subunit domain protein [Parcubacteria group bacterium GW2011_GWC2_39_14]KKR54904.1 MAG: Excinuclease ABC C subunit domain protein [Parcubacteria group bacterium GW2011_GWA2_40_23]